MKKFRIIIILSLLFLVAFFFYWYEWRTAEIRSECHNQALATKITPTLDMDRDTKIRLQYFAYNQEYDKCLNSKGLK